MKEETQYLLGDVFSEFERRFKFKFSNYQRTWLLDRSLRVVFAAEHSVQLTAFGVGLRYRFANWLVRVAFRLALRGGN